MLASFDVIEHIADCRAAFIQCLRVLKPGGRLLFSVPFFVRKRRTLIRARHSSDGEIIHLMPPEYHRDPLSKQGCLAYYHFGWSLLDDLRTIGFQQVAVQFFWSRHFAYLGGQSCVITAVKPG